MSGGGDANVQTANAIAEKTACPIVNYFDDFDVFMSHLISYDDLGEFWKDIFDRNMCWRDEIFVLETQLQKQTAAVRKAYENCQPSAEISKLRNRAYELQMELMYVRMFAINNPDKTADAPEVIPNKSVKNDLRRIFVEEKKIYDNKDFEAIFGGFEKKYADRLDRKDEKGNIVKGSYNTCVDPTWKELTEKWDEFVSTAAGLSPAWDKMKKQVSKKAKKIAEAPPKRRWGALEDWLTVRLNSVAPMETLYDIYEEFQKNIPSGGGTYSDLLTDIQTAKNRYTADIERIDLRARYEMLYRDDSDEAVRIFGEKIDALNQILRDTFPIQKSLFKCAATIQAKQCRNKP